jgi:flagellin
MSLVVNTNIASMNAQRSLMSSSKDLQSAMERLSTGKKINSAADDAAGFAIAENMTAQVRGLSMAAKNANDGLGLLKVVENATNDVTDMLQRIRELAVQAQSGTNSESDISNLQLEAEALMQEITRVSEDTTYNGVAYLGNKDSSGAQILSDPDVATSDPITSRTVDVQVGYNDGDTIQLKTYTIDTFRLGLEVQASTGTANASQPVNDASDGTGTDLFDDETNFLNIEKSGALAVITAAIDKVAGYKAEWGAGQNRLEYTVSNLMNVVEFTTAAQSRIQDADFAVEAANLAKAQVLQQTGTAMLAQANAAPQMALQLLK